MTAYNLLSELRQAGVVVKASGHDRLVVDAPKGALTPDLRAALAEHKKELLAILTVTEQRSQLEMELPERAIVTKVPAIRRETPMSPGAVSNSISRAQSSPVPGHLQYPVEKAAQSPVESPVELSIPSSLKSAFQNSGRESISPPVTKSVPSEPQSQLEGSAESIEEKIRNLEQEAARLRAAQEARRAEAESRQKIESEIKRREEEAARLLQQEETRQSEREAVRLAEQERWEAAAIVRKKAAEEAELRRAEEERRTTQLEARRHAEEEIARRRAEEEIRKVEEQLASLRAEEVNRRAEVAARWQAEDDRWLAETENRRSADEQAALEYAAAERERQEAEARYRTEDEASRTRAEASLRTIREEISRLRSEQRSYGAAETIRQAADEASRKAADEARRRAEGEALLKAEEDARQREAEEQRLRAEQESRLRAEQEARQRAEEERRQESEARLRVLEEERRALEEQAKAKASTGAAQLSEPQWFPVNLDDREDSRRAESSPNLLELPEVDGMTAESEGSFIEYQEFEPRSLQLHSSAITQEAGDADSDFHFLEDSPESGGAGDALAAVPNTTLDMLASENVSERCAAVADLPNLGGEDAFTHISAAFDDPAEEVRTAAARALFNFQADRAAAFTRALREAPADRRRKIGAAIASSGLASEAIGNLTGESREKTYDAFSLLFLMSKAGEVHPLLRAIEEHANIEVRLAVVKLLALSGQHEILPAFRRLAVRGSLPPEVRSSVMEAIYQISSQVSADTPSAA